MNKFLGTLGALVIVAIVTSAMGCVPLPNKVKQGYTLVIAHNLGSQKGQVTEKTAGIAWLRHFYVDSFKMPNSIQEDEYRPFFVVSKDNQRLPVSLVMQYRVNPVTGCGSALYVDYRKDIDRIIKDDLNTSTVDLALRTFSNYNADEIFGQQISSIADTLTHYAKRGALIGTRNQDGILCLEVQQIKVADVDADDAIKKAVANKIVRDQEVQEEEAKTKIKAERVKQDSLQAATDAFNNRALQVTLTPEVLRRMELENEAAAIAKWNGVLPTYSGEIPLIFQRGQ